LSTQQPAKLAKRARTTKTRHRRAQLGTIDLNGKLHRFWFEAGQIHIRRVGSKKAKPTSVSLRQVYDLAIGQTPLPLFADPKTAPTA
jgi:hypothetical protein